MLEPHQLLNKANDLAYSLGVAARGYMTRVDFFKVNAGAFILEIKGGLVSSAMVLIIKDVKAGEEIGVAYGYSFWEKNASMARYVASLSDFEVCELKSMLSTHFS